MRKQFVVARGLPAQGIAERVGIDRNQKQAGLAEEMLLGGLGHLRGRGKMNEAVADVVGTAAVDALPFGLAPGRSRADFVDRAHGFGRPACRFPRDFRNFRPPAPTVSARPAHFKGCLPRAYPTLAPAAESRFIEVIIPISTPEHSM